MQIQKRDSRILGLTSLALLLMFIFPLWHIDLQAPQYPEGIGLRIMISNVRGLHEHDLNNINNLNHYIGMKRIEPDAIPELRIMPVFIGFMIVFGLIAAYTRKRWMLLAWTVTFLVASIAGLVDFWLWEYDYGHNLNVELAIIKVPGMFYQPPLLGSKQLLNFNASSWPGAGGWIAILSVAIGCALTYKNYFTSKRKSIFAVFSAGWIALAGTIGLGLVSALLLTGCSKAPQPIFYGQDQGEHCRMTISDNRFASQIVTVTGRAYKFDSIECLVSYIKSEAVATEDISSIWVVDAGSPGTLVTAETAHFVRSSAIRSPMAGGLMAFASVDAADALATELDGARLSWTALQNESFTSK